jgi:peptidyl-prolyl cis-trans isomerase SurA
MALRKRWACLAAAVAASAAVSSDAPRAEASIVERIVAVVGERPILLSELRSRARPHLYRIIQQTQNPAQQAAQESEMFRELLSRMIDERLEEQAAAKANITVGSDEVDAGIKQVAAHAHIDVPTAIAEAKRQGGLSEQDYRDEIRRQVLEGKLIQLRVRNRVRVTDADARAVYSRWVKEMRKEQTVDLRLLALAIPPDATEERAKARVARSDVTNGLGRPWMHGKNQRTCTRK